VSLRLEHRGPTMVLTLDRAEAMNAFDEDLVARLTAAYQAASRDPGVRAVVLQAEGPAFCAGADVARMRDMANAPQAENLEDARRLATLMRTVDLCPKATLARVQGAAFGGGLGLIACCDIAIAADGATFSASEVRLGLIPAVIGPYLVRAVGPRAARWLMISGERIGAADALRLGLVHVVADAEGLDAAVARRVASVLNGGPQAIAAAKLLGAGLAPIPDDLIEDTVRRIADIRASEEAREGLTAFLEKRKPDWRP
jgi:methylglutaconyl-CoA hydratase